MVTKDANDAEGARSNWNVRSNRMRRTIPIAGFAARAASGRMVAALQERAGNKRATERFHQRTAERYTDLLSESKGVLMKAGQILSFMDWSSSDDGPLSIYQAALGRLQSDAAPMDATTAVDTLESELGRPVGEVFARFDREPLAAASIGQVHDAELPDGRHVAVKIQYPGIADAIRADLANTQLLATFIQLGLSLAPRSMRAWQKDAAREISARIAEEIDYHNEMSNIQRFSDLYRGHPFIRVPEVIREASSSGVITMTYVDGISWKEAQSADQSLKNSWAEVIMRFGYGSFRHAGFFQADPHPGNYRFGLDGSIGFVDFGCVKSLSEFRRDGLVRSIRTTLDHQLDDLRTVLQQQGFFGPDSDLTKDEVYGWCSQTVRAMTGPQPFAFGSGESTSIIRQVLESNDAVLRRMDVPADWVFISRLSLGIDTVLAELQATGYYRSIVDDLDGVAEPETELGKKHVVWARDRGLPFGMDQR